MSRLQTRPSRTKPKRLGQHDLVTPWNQHLMPLSTFSPKLVRPRPILYIGIQDQSLYLQDHGLRVYGQKPKHLHELSDKTSQNNQISLMYSFNKGQQLRLIYKLGLLSICQLFNAIVTIEDKTWVFSLFHTLVVWHVLYPMSKISITGLVLMSMSGLGISHYPDQSSTSL